MQYLLLSSPILGQGAKIGFSASLLLVSATATIFSFNAPTQEKINEIQKINEPVKNFFNTTLSQAFTEGVSSIYEKYKSWFGEEIKENISKESLERITNQLKKWGTGTKSWGGAIETTFKNGMVEEINYYLFQLGGVIKAVIRNIPLIARDSIIEGIRGETPAEGNKKVLFGYQKIQKLVTNSKMINFLEAAKEVLQVHGKVLNNLTYRDGKAIINTFKHLSQKDETRIKSALSLLETNSKSVKSKNYLENETQKLLKDIFLGEGWKKMKGEVEKLKKQLEEMEAQVKEALKEAGISVEIEQFKKLLEGLKGSLPEFEEAQE
ncbi:hypothetical protein [Candidatus Mycoplasma haematohominis]|uniref:hypothetical protein n=1 Tax=Candidatus Mycoplasma haematohominis TaxID=1494318 RepID=UPI001C0A739E|nr:hypothetical protein [Candidatus Mycoplasma haemohominis]